MTLALPIAIIGAGPVGLAAAAHLSQRGERFIVLETGSRAGHAIGHWGHVRMFSPWRYNVDRAAGQLLEAHGWRRPNPDILPTGDQLVRFYLDPLAALREIGPHIRFDARVTAVGRRDLDKVKTSGRSGQPFELSVVSSRGREDRILARAVVDASGTWSSPNPLGSGGYAVSGELMAGDSTIYGIPDVLGRARETYAGKTTLVVGSGHSAINCLLDLVALAQDAPGTRALWAVRRTDRESLFGGGAADALAARGALGSRVRDAVSAGQIELLAPFRTRAIRPRDSGRVDVLGVLGEQESTLTVNRIVAATGFRPDFSFLREIRLGVDPWLEATEALALLIDPNLHSCGTVRPHGAAELAHPEPDFYVVGAKSYGRAPTFLLATGHEQVRSVTAALNGDRLAAARVELELPETGVCAAPLVASAPSSAGCCGGPAPSGIDACCVADADARTAGNEGCGCSSTPMPRPRIDVASPPSAA